QPAKPPATFKGDLRPYQSEGVGWLDFLSEFGFGGILADDMGLGKTVQTLAHIARQKKAGLVTHPVLIVGPTSTIPNWLAEIERFTPTLKVLKLHGPHRKMDFVSIPRYDIVLTSYPLLARDRQDLIDYEFHAIVLDEAQNVKNATTNVAKASSELKANYRVALSGTPIENNLDELWSLFRFAMPGLLGGLTEFRREFRFPIENQNSNAARELLARRIRPFILRRTKEEVVKELPPKTVIVDRIEFDDAQRDLYDALLLTVEQRVREAVESRGWDKSRMEILELLLRLRQVCCDPKLLKTDEAPESAKLDRLVEMLSELASEGRRALVFSQFTSMLDLMEPRLKEQGLAWVRLSGNTKDRATPVKRFQAGEVPIFLISLRAGGTGLNLTAADTVIHYDPWWNPAVENQATDRAHRIGQDKPVFVYKLVAANTIEEKIIQLQEKKTNLAGALLAKDGDFAKSLTPEEIQWMLKG
ncbi:MAG TPA: DEAD/DEAH box helicase, partial [Fimbriimonas sp.]|nr:DEAD/DEAH box helicase [Fimbriimonas sp.]